VSHCLGEERRDDALALASELKRAFGALAADAESLAALKALRSAVASGTLTAGVLGEVGGVLGRWEWERRGRRGAWELAEVGSRRRSVWDASASHSGKEGR